MPEGARLTVTLRSGVMWNTSPPRAVTVADVVRGIKRACNPSPVFFGGMADFEATIKGLSAFCEPRGRSLLELAFAWLLSHPALASVIAGATRPEQIEANVNAATWELTPEEVAEVNGISAKG